MKKRTLANAQSASSKLVESLEPRQLLSTTLAPGVLTTGSITAAKQVKTYTFSAAKSSYDELDTYAAVTDKGFIGNFTLKSPSGAEESWHGNGATPESLQDLAAGTYTLSVDDYYAAYRGTFSLGLEGLSPINPTHTALAWGGVTAGKISQIIGTQEFTFTLSTQQVVALSTAGTATSSGFVAKFQLLNSKDVSFGSWSGNGAQGIAPGTLAAGTYMLKVSDYYLLHTGTVSIGLDRISTPFSSGIKPLTSGGIVTGEISQVVGTKEFSFNVGNTSVVQLKTTGTPIGTGFIADFTLYNSAGAQVGSSWSGNGAEARAPVSLAKGTYMMRVSDYYWSHEGEFSIGVEYLSAPFSDNAKPLADGKISGSISGAIATDAYTFAAIATSASFNTSGSATSGNFIAEFTLYDAKGNLKKQWWGNFTQTITATGLTPAEDYDLVVTDYYNAYIGTFSVDAQGVVPVTLS